MGFMTELLWNGRRAKPCRSIPDKLSRDQMLSYREISRLRLLYKRFRTCWRRPEALEIELMMKKIAIAIALSLLAFTASAEVVKPSSRGGLRAQVVVTDNAGKLQALAAKQDKTPIIRNKQTMRQRHRLHVGTLISGLAADQDGNYDGGVSYRVYDPEEQVIVEQESYAVATGAQLDPKVFVMALPAYEFSLERRSPKGPYIIEAIVLDKVSGNKSVSRQRVILE